jgi:hypothetical protein
MLTPVLAILARWGVPEHLRRPLAGVMAGIALLALLGGAWAIWLHFHDARVIDRHDAALNLDAERKARAADAAAADQRVKDAADNAEQSEAYHDAIDAASSGAPSDAAVRLGCERLRRAGKVDPRAAAICGP